MTTMYQSVKKDIPLILHFSTKIGGYQNYPHETLWERSIANKKL